MTSRKKLNQSISPEFSPDEEGWEIQEKTLITDKKKVKKKIIKKEILPHKKTIEEIIVDVREVFFDILEMVLNKENPIKYILSEDKNQFCFCIIVIVIGIILLLLSNIL